MNMPNCIRLQQRSALAVGSRAATSKAAAENRPCRDRTCMVIPTVTRSTPFYATPEMHISAAYRRRAGAAPFRRQEPPDAFAKMANWIMRFLCTFLLFLATSTWGQAPRQIAAAKPQAEGPSRKSALHKSTLEAYLRHLYVWGPTIQVEIGEPRPSRRLPGFLEVQVRASAGGASQEELFYVSRDGSKILKGLVFDVARHPFHEEMARLATQSDPAFGPPHAPVTLVLFSDFQCGYCREEALLLRKNVPASFPEEVRVVFKDFPLESIHLWAKAAAVAGRCIFRQSAALFWDYHDWIYQHQAEITPENLKSKVMEFARAREKQMDLLQLQKCVDTGATEAEVNRTVAEGRALQVHSTPTLFVNGRRLVGQMAWNQLRQIIEYEIGYMRAAETDASCCEVRLPSPLKD